MLFVDSYCADHDGASAESDLSRLAQLSGSDHRAV